MVLSPYRNNAAASCEHGVFGQHPVQSHDQPLPRNYGCAQPVTNAQNMPSVPLPGIAVRKYTDWFFSAGVLQDPVCAMFSYFLVILHIINKHLLRGLNICFDHG